MAADTAKFTDIKKGEAPSPWASPSTTVDYELGWSGRPPVA